MSKDIEDLLKKLGNLSPEQLFAVSQAAATKATEQKRDAFKERITKVEAFIKEQGLTVHEVVNHFKAPEVEIFSWNGNTVMKGRKGKPPAWASQLKTEMGESEAKKFALNDDGKAWVANLYNPKSKIPKG